MIVATSIRTLEREGLLAAELAAQASLPFQRR